MPKPPEPPGDDPLGLGGVDREIRIEKLRREIDEVAGGEMFSGKIADCDPKVEEAFLENVLALETRGFVRPFDELVKDGFAFPPPDKLDDTSLTGKLEELVRAFASRRLFLEHTDHLSDRELYAWLWYDGLREEMMGFGLPFGNCHLDVLGSWGEDDTRLWLRYYATDDERAEHLQDYPDEPLPPKEKPVSNRDRRLPRPED